MKLVLEGDEILIVLGLAREGEKSTALLETIAPGIRGGERKRKIAHILARCEEALEERDAEAPLTATEDTRTNREKIAEAIEGHAAAGVPNA